MARFDHLELGPEPGPPDPSTTAGRHSAPPSSEQQSLHRADHHRRRGEYESALRFYSRALEHDKALIVGWVGQVQMLTLLDEAPEGDVWARKALELFPGHGELLAARAQALCRVGSYRDAGACCDGAIQAAGGSAFRWQVRGEWMLATKQALHEHAFAKARESNPDWLVATETARIHLHYQFPSRAVVFARQAAEAAPDQAFAWLVRGQAEAAAGMRQPATDSFRHCLQLCPRHADAETALAELRSSWSIAATLRNLLRR